MKILLIGATGTVGRAAADALAPHHDVVLVSRSTTPAVDVTETSSIEQLFRTVGTVDAVVSAVGHVPFRHLSDLTHDDYVSGFFGKVLTQLDIVRIGTPYVTDGGSFTLTTGVTAREPIATGAAAAMASGALESFVMAAAPEMPRGIRINAVSPTVLEEATSFDLFPGHIPASSHRVGQAYRRSVDGMLTGRTIPVD